LDTPSQQGHVRAILMRINFKLKLGKDSDQEVSKLTRWVEFKTMSNSSLSLNSISHFFLIESFLAFVFFDFII